MDCILISVHGQVTCIDHWERVAMTSETYLLKVTAETKDLTQRGIWTGH